MENSRTKTNEQFILNRSQNYPAEGKILYHNGSWQYQTYDELEEALRPPDFTHLSSNHRTPWIYTVPTYPDNLNPLIPSALQRQLDAMSPREFLTYVLHELTLEERESIMMDERQRRRTFHANWPYGNTTSLSGIRMAQSGFYSLDSGDRVQCVFCRGCIHDWEPDSNVMTEHARAFNFCRFVKGLECGNREYRSDRLTADDLANVSLYSNQTPDGAGQYESAPLGISTDRADMIRYAPDATRIQTFRRWPASSPINGNRLAEAGFYYTGFNDKVRCFYCGGAIHNWVATDDPWEEHARWFPDCAFLAQNKGKHYVDEVHRTTPSNKKCNRQTVSQKKEEVKKFEAQSSQDAMNDICQRLGHSVEHINQAIDRNGGPFDSIKTMIDVIYEIEAGESSSIPSTSGASNVPVTSTGVVPEADRTASATQRETQPRSQNTFQYELGCRYCERRRDRFVPATHIGLPCGHLILCDRCADEFKVMSANREIPVICPNPQCSSQLTGAMKIYLA